jgi:hypothetical protein
MRTLNRPMFRYGGPIKEGVMNGIREPKRNGGPMSQSVQPSGNGMRPGYKGKSSVLKYIPGFNYVAGQTKGLIPRIINKIKPTFKNQPGQVTGGTTGGTARSNKLGLENYKRNIQSSPAFSERAKAFVKENPYFTGAAAPFAVSGGIAATPPVLKGGYNLAEAGVKQIGDLLVPDFIFDQDKYFADKKKAKKDAENTTTLNTDIKKLLEQPTKPKKSEKELRAEQIAKYRDIVDIKGMNKDAAYNSLIAASQAISGEGDFKGSLKDGSLINKIIQSTSKAYDKPSKTKDAIDTLILKSEIEKDMNKDKNAIMDEYRMKQIALADKQLAGGGFSENKGVLSKNLSGQTLFDTAAAKSSPNFMGNLMTKKSLTDLMTEAKKKGDIVERDIIITTTEELIKGKGVPNGDYTVGDVLVTIVDGRVANVTR